MVKPRRSVRDDSLLPNEWEERGRIPTFRTALLKWYRKHRRVLPWRETHDPYRIWISEIMLQQTTVTAVIPYYERFFGRFPTLKDLAAAPEQEVLRLWEGLGYYSRARNLHRAAQIVVNDWKGKFPEEPERLEELPGIGRYTAGAIASFAFDRAAPIVEANTLRLYARLMALRGDPRTTANQSALWNFAEQLQTAESSVRSKTTGGDLNQALMELGSRCCTPVEPSCGECPVRDFCLARRDGLTAVIPELGPRKVMTDVHECAVLIARRGKWLVRQIPAGERWAGLWDFPRLKMGELAGGTAPASLLELDLPEKLKATYGIEARLVDQLKPMNHTVTRFKIRLSLAVMEYQKGKLIGSDASRWCSVEELHEVPLPVTGRKIVRMLEGEGERAGRLF